MKKLYSWLERWWLPALAVFVLGAFGVGGLWDALGWWAAALAVVVALVASIARFNQIAGRLVGAVVVGTLVLFGFNVVVDHIVDWVGHGRPPIEGGLAVAIVVFGLAAAWYLRGSKPKAGATPGAPERGWGRGEQWDRWLSLVTGGALAMFLIGVVPIIVERKDHGLPWVAIGLVVGLVLCVVGWICRDGDGRAHKIGMFAAPALGILAIGAVPLAVESSSRGGRVPTAQAMRSKIDVRIVTDGTVNAPPVAVTADPALRGFDVRYSVGYADGQAVRWTLTETSDAAEALRVAALGRSAPPVDATPVTRQDADPVLVLLVDGTPPVVGEHPEELPNRRGTHDEVGRWRRISHAAREPRMPVFALLQTTHRERLDRWRLFTTTGAAVSLQVLGRRTATEAGLALALAAPTAQADLALAVKHRPVLEFDRAEPVPRPLSIDWLFADGRVQLCNDRGASQDDCKVIDDPRQLKSGGTNLKLRVPSSHELRVLAIKEETAAAASTPVPAATVADVPGAPPAAALPATATAQVSAPETTIYVHPVPVQRDGRLLLYLDYWWYLPDNPVQIGHKAFCGAGLVIPGITCHNHESDWEGLTVVVDRTSGTPRVTSVQYAEHNEVVSFAWKQLRSRWRHDAALAKLVDGADDGAQRPLAFIAKGTHSTYALPCRASRCTQFTSGTGEAPYRGGLPWIGDVTDLCGKISCVQPLPTREGGQIPALWSAFAGGWGHRHCALTYYCDSESPPPAPGQQARYLHPTRCNGDGNDDWHFHRRPCDG
jgi:hypothetical protein